MKKIVSVFLVVLFVAAFFVAPVFAQATNPPAESVSFDWGAVAGALQTILTAILVPGAAFLVRWLSVKAKTEQARLSAEQQYAFDLFLKTCVYAAEQMKLKEFISDKLTYVLGLAETWLAARNLPIDLDEVRARIEANVMAEFNSEPALSE